MITSIFSLLLFIIVVCLVLGLAHYIVTHLPIPSWVGNCILALIALLCLIYLFQQLGLLRDVGSIEWPKG